MSDRQECVEFIAHAVRALRAARTTEDCESVRDTLLWEALALLRMIKEEDCV